MRHILHPSLSVFGPAGLNISPQSTGFTLVSLHLSIQADFISLFYSGARSWSSTCAPVQPVRFLFEQQPTLIVVIAANFSLIFALAVSLSSGFVSIIRD